LTDTRLRLGDLDVLKVLGAVRPNKLGQGSLLEGHSLDAPGDRPQTPKRIHDVEVVEVGRRRAKLGKTAR
jgi:hypothetical protein